MTASLTVGAAEGRDRVLGLALGFLGVAAFSLTLPMTRIAVAGFDPLTVVAWRGFIAALAAGAILAILRRSDGISACWRSRRSAWCSDFRC